MILSRIPKLIPSGAKISDTLVPANKYPGIRRSASRWNEHLSSLNSGDVSNCVFFQLSFLSILLNMVTEISIFCRFKVARFVIRGIYGGGLRSEVNYRVLCDSYIPHLGELLYYAPSF